MKKVVSEILANQVLVTITPDSPIYDALKKMEKAPVGSILVFGRDDNEFLGIVTMTDIATSAFGQNGGTVRDIMTPASKVIFVTSNVGLNVCREIMRTKHIHHLVVKNDLGDVVGVMSSIDLMHSDEDDRETVAKTYKDMPPG